MATILLVDDERAITDNLAPFLQRTGFVVEVAVDGEDALNKAARFSPDLIVSDVLMPRMDGWGVIREMRSEPRYAEIPIMILTTVIEDASRRRYELETGMAMDVQDYVQKPTRPADLLQRVAKLLKSDN